MARATKLSKHGTLNETDMSEATPICLDQVLQNCQDSNVRDYFGLAGELPPSKAQLRDQLYESIYELHDSTTGEPFIGINRRSSGSKGRVDIPLLPGEYKIELALPKALNSNLLHDISGFVVGGIASLAQQSPDTKETAFKRGLPSYYMDIRLRVAGKNYGIMDSSFSMDIGTQTTAVRTFIVREVEAPATLELRLFSHSFVKRLKLAGRLLRRDLTTVEELSVSKRGLMEQGREIVYEALAIQAKPASKTHKRIDDDVDPLALLISFYQMYAPDKTGNVEMVLQHFDGRIDDMITSLEIKYSVHFDRRGHATSLGFPGDVHSSALANGPALVPSTGQYT